MRSEVSTCCDSADWMCSSDVQVPVSANTGTSADSLNNTSVITSRNRFTKTS